MSNKRKSIQTITDPLLEPYFITKDEYSFAVKQNVTSDADHFRSKGNSKTYEKSLFYFPNFPNAIQKIAKLKAENGNFDSLEEYVKNYELISNQIKIYTDELRSTI